MASSQAKVQKLRLILVAVLISAFWLAIEANLFYRQILQNNKFERIAERQYLKKIPLPASRGEIYDSNNNKLVSNTLKYDIAADPSIVTNKVELARACSKAFKKPQSHFLDKLNRENRFTYLARRVPDRDIQEILALRDPGLIKTRNFRREYPYRSYGAQLLGFTDPDDRGLSGLELQYDEQLRGIDGEAVLQYDGPRRVFYNADNPILKPVAGNDIYLTIDKDIQTVVEQELATGVKSTKAKAGMAIVMDPNSGAILAMANYPVFDPNRQHAYGSGVKRNRIITDVFEPGSTLKIITAAAILQEQLKKEDDIVYCEQGKFKLYNRYFHDTKKHGWLSFKKAVAMSSNIGIIKLSDVLPSRTLFRYLRNFGFGTDTGIGLNGETSGLLDDPQKWSKVSRASISIGYSIGITMVQLAAAYSAAINGGYLYRPYVVEHLKNEAGEIFQTNQPQIVRQVVSKEVSKKLKEFMYAAVKDGTGKEADIEGVKVGGKTGTARKMDPKTRTYSTRNYTASFVGFAPFDNPDYVLAIVMDEPRTAYYGGQVAAPVFGKIMDRIVHLNKEQSRDHRVDNVRQDLLVQKMQDLPPVTGFRIETARALLDEKNLDYKIIGKGSFVNQVSVKEDKIILESGNLLVRQNKVPHLTGLTLREALQKIDLARFRIQLSGDATGIVQKQDPPPGKAVTQRTSLTLVCR